MSQLIDDYVKCIYQEKTIYEKIELYHYHLKLGIIVEIKLRTKINRKLCLDEIIIHNIKRNHCIFSTIRLTLTNDR